ncbi:hypothetical protein AYI68_g2973, partial [Smittium mucronatum]
MYLVTMAIVFAGDIQITDQSTIS